jgi:hypothetical protein
MKQKKRKEKKVAGIEQIESMKEGPSPASVYFVLKPRASNMI